MISEWLIEFASTIATWIAGLFPEWELPAWLSNSRDGVIAFVAGYVGLGVWINWSVLGWCITACAIAYAAVVAIKLFRAALAHVPQFGGKGD